MHIAALIIFFSPTNYPTDINKGSTTWSSAATDIDFYIGYDILFGIVLTDIVLTDVLSRDVDSRDVISKDVLSRDIL